MEDKIDTTTDDNNNTTTNKEGKPTQDSNHNVRYVRGLSWNPVIANQLATCGEDSSIKVCMICIEIGNRETKTDLNSITLALLQIWNTEDGTLQDVLNGHNGDVFAVEYSPINSHLIVSASADRTIKLWNIQTKEVIHYSII